MFLSYKPSPSFSEHDTVPEADEATLRRAAWTDETFVMTVLLRDLPRQTIPHSEIVPFALGLRGKKNPRQFRVPLAVRVSSSIKVPGLKEWKLEAKRAELENACRLAGDNARVALLTPEPRELSIRWTDELPSREPAVIDVRLSSNEYFYATRRPGARLTLSFCSDDDIETKRNPIESALTKVTLHRGVLVLRAKLRRPGDDLKAVEVLLTRQNTTATLPLVTELRPRRYSHTTSHSWTVDASINLQRLLADRDLAPGKWNVRVILKTKDGQTLSASLRRPLKGFGRRHAFRSHGVLRDPKSNLLAFPEVTRRGNVVLTVRTPTEADSRKARLLQNLALLLWLLLPNVRDRRSWLITEKKAETAQDNSFAFFEYCCENHPKKRVYYLMRKNSAHRARLTKRMDRVIDFGSLRHYMLVLRCGVLVSSEAAAHFLDFDSVPSLLKFVVRLKKHVFLQHGVTAMKNVAPIFGRAGLWGSDRYITTSKWEQSIAVEFLGYSEEEAPVTGFARWDLLCDKSASRRQVMIMPTWRNWLQHHRPDEFERSEFFSSYREFLCSAETSEFLERFDATIVFVLHPYLEKFTNQFSSGNPRIEILSARTRPINELLMESKVLVSDYSSVVWDFFKMKKPVVFFHFDSHEYLRRHGSFIDFETHLIGPRATSVPELAGMIRDILENGCQVPTEYMALHQRAFSFDDRRNCERIFAVVEALEREKFHEARKFLRLILGGKSHR